MLIQRTDVETLATREEAIPTPAVQILVGEGDRCVVMQNGQVLGEVGPGHWGLAQLPFGARVIGTPGNLELTFVNTRLWPVRIGTKHRSRAGDFMLVAEAEVRVHDPVTFVRNLSAGDPGEAAGYLSKVIVTQLRLALGPAMDDSGNVDQSKVSADLAGAVQQTFEPLGVSFQQLSRLALRRRGGAGASAAGALPETPADSRVTLLGTIAGCAATEAADEDLHRWERFGMFVMGDPYAMRRYGGLQPTWRWLARGAGDLIEEVQGWPRAPDGSFDYHFPTQEQAHAYYGALRQHAMASVPGLQAQDTRGEMRFNAPNGWSETLWSQGREVLYLLFDIIEDMEAIARETDTIDIHDSGPPSPQRPPLPLVAFKSVGDVHYVGVRGSETAADHVLIVHSERGQPVPTMTDGLPRAEWMKKIDEAQLRFYGDLLVLAWGRFSGTDLLGKEDPNDPGASLNAKLGQQIGMPLSVDHEAGARLGAPPGYVIRMSPGTYSVCYYELSTDDHGAFTCCAISRDGAESFLPQTVGNAGGVRFGGLTVEQYAMLSVERDNLLAQMGPQGCFSPQMAALCQRYGVPYVQSGMAGRIDEWEQYIQGDAAFSAQWVTHRSMATAKLHGHQVSESQMAVMAQHQQYVQNAVEQHANHLDAIRDAAIHLIRSASGFGPTDCLTFLHGNYPQLSVEQVLYKAVRILFEPEEYGRFDTVESCTEPIARAHYQSMDDEKKRYNRSEEAYLKETRNRIYKTYGLELPGFFNRFFNG